MLEREDDRQLVEVAASADEVLGFVAAGPSREEGPTARIGEIYAIYVRPDSWSAGTGRALLNSALEHLRAAGMREALLWVLASNARTRRFYELAGWVQDGFVKVKRLPDGDVEVEQACYRRRLACG